MSTIIDLRQRRIEACCAHAIECSVEAPLATPRAAAGPDGAEIILFPKAKIKPKRQRKELKRRFSVQQR
ncbi:MULTISPECIES: hypothetical protein [Rhodomicrobium]|uniref:hypothetical protein n=1 Tax=Rhodomicrobium TaxID=1068 RepID=UPI000B4B0BFA|nr:MULTISPECIES: hypothetical protein [Rhodomicrobium]